MFGLELYDLTLLPALLVALAAGVVSFLSPCVLPIVPPYLAYMSGIGMAEARTGRARTLLPAAFFVLGLSTVFLLLGFTFSWVGQFFLGNQVLFTRIAGVVIIVFGLHFLGVFRLPFLMYEARIDAGRKAIAGRAFEDARQLPELDREFRRADHAHRSVLELEIVFGRFEDMRLGLVAAKAFGIGEVGQRGQDAGDAQLDRLFHDEIGAGLLDRREE